jgi:hypothetical protein
LQAPPGESAPEGDDPTPAEDSSSARAEGPVLAYAIAGRKAGEKQMAAYHYRLAIEKTPKGSINKDARNRLQQMKMWPMPEWLKNYRPGGATVAAQTPQAFRADLFREAHAHALRDGFRATDDSALVERLGHPVRLVHGSSENIKITTTADLLLADQILIEREMTKFQGRKRR